MSRYIQPRNGSDAYMRLFKIVATTVLAPAVAAVPAVEMFKMGTLTPPNDPFTFMMASFTGMMWGIAVLNQTYQTRGNGHGAMRRMFNCAFNLQSYKNSAIPR